MWQVYSMPHCYIHTSVAIVQGKTVSVSGPLCNPLNRPELKQWSNGFDRTVTDSVSVGASLA